VRLVKTGGGGANVAVTPAADVIVSVHVPLPVQAAPVHPVKVEPPVGVAVSVTDVPWLNVPLHVGPQSMLAGTEVTAPLPVPALVTVRLKVFKLNVAVTMAD
jgi:hypothetical protein